MLALTLTPADLRLVAKLMTNLVDGYRMKTAELDALDVLLAQLDETTTEVRLR